MDIIEVKVKGNYVTKDNKNAGTQGEANANALRIEFDAGWDGCSKTINWWDAKGIFAVGRVLTADLLEDLKASTRIYLTEIPGEAMREWGQCMFGIDGYINGKRKRSVYAKLVVKPGQGSIVLEEVTPSQIEQLQVQIDTLLADMQAEANRASAAANAAAKSEAAAESAASRAITNADLAAASAIQARGYASTAENAALTAHGASQQAQMAQSAAEAAKSGAEESAEAARLSHHNAAKERESAQLYRTEAQNAQTRAETAAKTAVAAKDSAETSKTAAENAKASAENAKTAAESAQKLAEKARDTAVEASKNGAGISLINKAAVGQLIMVSKVDANGVPTKWEAIDRTHYKYTNYGEMYYAGPPGLNEPIPPGQIIGNAWDIMTTTHELEYIMDGISYVRQASSLRNGSKEYRYIGNGALGGFGSNNGDDFCLYVMYDQSTHMTTIDAVYGDGSKPELIFIKEQDEVVYEKLDPEYLPGLKVTLTYPNSSTQEFSHTGAEILAAWSAGGTVVCEFPERGIYLAAVGPMYNGDALHAFLFKEYIWSDANGVTEREYLVPADSKTVDVG